MFLLTANAQSAVNNSTNSIDSIQQSKLHIQQPDKDGVYDQVEKMPQFPGGENSLLKYIAKHLKYPASAQRYGIQGTIIIRFVVNEFGHVDNFEVLKGLDPDIDQEGIRVISSLPDWIPGEQNGEKVKVYYTIPLKFILEVPSSLKPAAILDGKPLPINFDIKTLNKDSIQSVFVIKPDQKEKLAELARKYKTNTSNGVFILVSKAYARQNTSETVQPVNEEKVYDVVENMPQFPGGQQALMSYITRNLKYPRFAKESGLVIVRFVVNKEGVVDNIEVLRSVSTDLDNEAVRVVGSLPKWIPGTQNGAKVSVYFTLPIKFK
ncbi:MAG TPA: energy transducer TonB [Paludibacter sp.]|nr:energy transducer TonB [Paludibacter sp.]